MKKQDNFCVMPFISGCVNTDGQLQSCCAIQIDRTEKIYNIKKDSIYDWWQSDYISKLKNKFERNERPIECRTCWGQEDKGLISLRQEKNKEWLINLNSDLDKQIKRLSSYSNSLPIDWELQLTNLCNLKCQMCTGRASSKLLIENKKIFSKADIKLEIQEQEEKNFKQEEFDINDHGAEQILEIFKNKKLKSINLRGGEPFMVPNIKKLLKTIVEQNIAEKILLQITTNGTIYDEEINFYLKKFKKVRLMWSVESTDKQNNFLRYPSDWSQIQKNILNYKKLQNLSIIVNTTITNLSCLYIDQIINFCIEHQLYHQFYVARWPIYMTWDNLPKETLELVQKKIKRVVDEHKVQPKNLKEFLMKLDNKIKNYEFDETKWNYFVNIIKMRNSFRNINMKEFMPDLARMIYS